MCKKMLLSILSCCCLNLAIYTDLLTLRMSFRFTLAENQGS